MAPAIVCEKLSFSVGQSSVAKYYEVLTVYIHMHKVFPDIYMLHRCHWPYVFFFYFWISTQHTCFSSLKSVFFFFFLPLDGKLKHMISFQHNKLKKGLLWNTNDSIRKYFKRHWKHSVEDSHIVPLLVAKLRALEWRASAISQLWQQQYPPHWLILSIA